MSTEVRDGMQQTPLQIAVQFGHVNIVKFLIDNGADILATDDDTVLQAWISKNKPLSSSMQTPVHNYWTPLASQVEELDTPPPTSNHLLSIQHTPPNRRVTLFLRDDWFDRASNLKKNWSASVFSGGCEKRGYRRSCHLADFKIFGPYVFLIHRSNRKSVKISKVCRIRKNITEISLKIN